MLRLPSIAFGVALLAVLWLGVFILIDSERAADRKAIAADTLNLSRVFEQNVIRTLSEIDRTLLYVRHGQAMDRRTDWPHHIKQPFTASGFDLRLSVIDARGRLVAANHGPQPPRPLDLSDRDHFRVHAYLPGDTIHIGKPLLGRVSMRWAVLVLVVRKCFWPVQEPLRWPVDSPGAWCRAIFSGAARGKLSVGGRSESTLWLPEALCEGAAALLS